MGEKSQPAVHLTGLISTTYKELKKVNIKRTNHLITKSAKELNSVLTKKYTDGY